MNKISEDKMQKPPKTDGWQDAAPQPEKEISFSAVMCFWLALSVFILGFGWLYVHESYKNLQNEGVKRGVMEYDPDRRQIVWKTSLTGDM